MRQLMMNNFTDQGPLWEADSWTGGQEFSSLVWNPKVHYRFHKSQPPGLIVIQSTVSCPIYFLFDSDTNVCFQFIW
jgi:hypothetical protein